MAWTKPDITITKEWRGPSTVRWVVDCWGAHAMYGSTAVRHRHGQIQVCDTEKEAQDVYDEHRQKHFND